MKNNHGRITCSLLLLFLLPFEPTHAAKKGGSRADRGLAAVKKACEDEKAGGFNPDGGGVRSAAGTFGGAARTTRNRFAAKGGACDAMKEMCKKKAQAASGKAKAKGGKKAAKTAAKMDDVA